MALNYIWITFFVATFLFALYETIFHGNIDIWTTIMTSSFDSAKTAFELSLGLTGVLSLWMGIMRIGEKGGVIQFFSRLVSPLFSRLFPGVPKNHPAMGSIFMNVSANMLGLDNAATPVGVKAMQELQSINPKKDTASNSMIMFMTLNTSGLTIIPVSIMAYRAKYGAADPADIFIPLLLTTMCSTLVGLIIVSLYQRINLFQKSFLIMFAVIAALVATLFITMMGMSTEQMQNFCRLLTSILILGAIMIFIYSGWRKKLNVYNSFIEGAKSGFNVAVSLIPYCVAILAAVGVFRASGALDLLQGWLKAGVEYCGLNSDFVGPVPVALMKPLNGSGARGMMLECFESFGPDSFVGHLASVLQGSTDTTFYILAIYFGSVGIKKYRYSVTCGLMADVAGMIAAVFISYCFFFGN